MIPKDLFKKIKMINNYVYTKEPEEGVFDSILDMYIDGICNAINAGKDFTNRRVCMKYDWLLNKLLSINNLQVDLNHYLDTEVLNKGR